MAKKTPTAPEPNVDETPAQTPDPKPVTFLGSSRQGIKDFPQEARREAGYAIDALQNGKLPSIPIKPFPTIGTGASELIIDTKDGWFRVFYVVKFAEGVYVLHSFQKKTNKTSKNDVETGERRYEAMLKLRAKK